MGGGPVAGMLPGEKARDFKGTMAKLIQYLGTYRLSILVVIDLCHRLDRRQSSSAPRSWARPPPSCSKA